MEVGGFEPQCCIGPNRAPVAKPGTTPESHWKSAISGAFFISASLAVTGKPHCWFLIRRPCSQNRRSTAKSAVPVLGPIPLPDSFDDADPSQPFLPARPRRRGSPITVISNDEGKSTTGGADQASDRRRGHPIYLGIRLKTRTAVSNSSASTRNFSIASAILALPPKSFRGRYPVP